MRRHEEEKPENHERWLLTYADLITLLMVFFVVMFAMSSVDSKKYEQLSQSLNVAFNGGSGVLDNKGHGMHPGENKNQETDDIKTESKGNDKAETEEEEKLKKLKEEIDEYLKTHNLTAKIVVNQEEKGLVIRFKDAAIFDEGKADIREESINTLNEIGKTINHIDNYISVEGHTDNTPIKNSYFTSNWELSAIRATNVVHFLITKSKISADRFTIVGHGEFRPISPNSSEQEKSKNRRTEIVILKNEIKPK